MAETETYCNEAKVYCYRQNAFSTVSEISSILDDVDETKVSYVPPVKPKGGEVYVFASGDSNPNKDDWKSDRHRWHYNTRNKLPRKDPVYMKSFFDITAEDGPSKEFTKNVIVPVSNSKYILIHYRGDESISKDLPHGNSKSLNRTFVRTAPSVLKKLKESTHREPSLTYKRFVTESSVNNNQQGILNPRNLKQVQNTKQNEKQRQRITRDDLYNLHELAYHLKGYFWKIETFPDLLCIVALDEMIEEFNRVVDIQLQDTREKKPIFP